MEFYFKMQKGVLHQAICAMQINNLISSKTTEKKFYYNTSLQLQSRYSSFLQEKLKGTLSHQEETLQFNQISNNIITLIDEILTYKNMQAQNIRSPILRNQRRATQHPCSRCKKTIDVKERKVRNYFPSTPPATPEPTNPHPNPPRKSPALRRSSASCSIALA